MLFKKQKKWWWIYHCNYRNEQYCDYNCKHCNCMKMAKFSASLYDKDKTIYLRNGTFLLLIGENAI